MKSPKYIFFFFLFLLVLSLYYSFSLYLITNTQPHTPIGLSPPGLAHGVKRRRRGHMPLPHLHAALAFPLRHLRACPVLAPDGAGEEESAGRIGITMIELLWMIKTQFRVLQFLFLSLSSFLFATYTISPSWSRMDQSPTSWASWLSWAESVVGR